ncbi:MAG: outer membrane beta-barrel protein [Flavobacteriales bacterium]|nr:outer membrane beta-barrel protein [Flavobacteriales bacterium]
MNIRITSLAVSIGIMSSLNAQVNEKGAVHLAAGIAVGGHATRYEQSFLGVVQTTNDGAATTTLPIEFGYGLGGRFSLGLLLEPGLYLDSVESESNTLTTFAIQPRFYLVNGDRFTWMASMQLGSTRLKYDVSEPGNVSSAVYRGAHFGLSSGVGFYFTDRIGLNVQLRYMATTMPLRDWSWNGTSLDPDLIDAKLSTSGLAVQASLAFKF